MTNDEARLRHILAVNLTSLVRQSGRTQAQVADATCISRSAMSSYCNGVRYPRPSQLKALAEYFKISVGALTDDSQERNKNEREFSHEAYWIAQSFEELDRYGRELVQMVVENELRRYAKQKDENRRRSADDDG